MIIIHLDFSFSLLILSSFIQLKKVPFSSFSSPILENDPFPNFPDFPALVDTLRYKSNTKKTHLINRKNVIRKFIILNFVF